MVRLTGVPPRGIILGLKGVVDFYSWKGRPVARRWPRKPTQPRTLAVQQQWPDFVFITQGFKEIQASVTDGLYAMQQGTQLTTKDQAVQLFYGYSIEEDPAFLP